MLGKTNILFVSKSDASEVQLVYEKYLTPTTGDIIKIEYINNMIFAYTSDKEVLYGSDVRSLKNIKKDGKNLTATHFMFHDKRYYFCNAYDYDQEKGIVYATKDFNTYEEITIAEDIYISEDQKAVFSVSGIFKDSQGRLVVMIRVIDAVSKKNTKVNLYILSTFEELQDKAVITCNDNNIGAQYTEALDNVLYKDRIFTRGNYGSDYISDLEGNVQGIDKIQSYANDYFFRIAVTTDHINVSNQIIALYRSFNGVNWSKCSSFNVSDAQAWKYSTYDTNKHVFSISGKTCLVYKRQEEIYVNIADTISKIGDSSNTTFDLDLREFDHICAIAEDGEGNTYMGFSGGIIVKLYLDQDGTTKLPDVQLVKTLAAKQALEQAKRYTDEKVAELKAYFDGCGVTQEKNGDV